MPPPKPKQFPDLYKKYREMLKAAEKCTDPDLKKLELLAAHRYFEADIKQSAPLPMWGLIVMLVGFYLLVLVTVVWAYSRLPVVTATIVFVLAFSIVSLLIGVVLRVGGYISESSLLSIWRAGFKAVTSLKRDAKEK